MGRNHPSVRRLEQQVSLWETSIRLYEAERAGRPMESSARIGDGRPDEKDPALSAMRGALDLLNREREVNLRSLSPQHPTVLQYDRDIADMTARMNKLVARGPDRAAKVRQQIEALSNARRAVVDQFGESDWRVRATDWRLTQAQLDLKGGLDPTSYVGEYYVGGHARRVGVYSLTGREITLSQAIIAAGGLEDTLAKDGLVVRIVRRGTSEAPMRETLELPLSALDDPAASVVLMPNDEIHVGLTPSTQPTTTPAT